MSDENGDYDVSPGDQESAASGATSRCSAPDSAPSMEASPARSDETKTTHRPSPAAARREDSNPESTQSRTRPRKKNILTGDQRDHRHVDQKGHSQILVSTEDAKSFQRRMCLAPKMMPRPTEPARSLDEPKKRLPGGRLEEVFGRIQNAEEEYQETRRGKRRRQHADRTSSAAKYSLADEGPKKRKTRSQEGALASPGHVTQHADRPSSAARGAMDAQYSLADERPKKRKTRSQEGALASPGHATQHADRPSSAARGARYSREDSRTRMDLQYSLADERPDMVEFLKLRAASGHAKGTPILDSLINVRERQRMVAHDDVSGYLCFNFLEQSKRKKVELEKLFEEAQTVENLPVALQRMEPSSYAKPSTTNWSPTYSANGHEVAKSPLAICIENVRQKLVNHQGEVRSWGVEPEQWHPMKDRTRELKQLWQAVGGDNDLLEVHRRSEARKTMVSASGDKVDEVFSWNFIACGGCTPDFNDPISTVAVYDKKYPHQICVRQVNGITLAEVLMWYRNDFTFEKLYNTWIKGKIVVRRRPSRSDPTKSKTYPCECGNCRKWWYERGWTCRRMPWRC